MHKVYSGPEEILSHLISRYPVLVPQEKNIQDAFDLLCTSFESGGKLLLCGNGGSASDCQHIAGELMKSFTLRREPDCEFESSIREMYPESADFLLSKLEQGLPAIPLTESTSLLTAVINDTASDTVYAQQVYSLANHADTLLCISTSGNSTNCVLAAQTAQALGLFVISLTGSKDSKLSEISDITIQVPAMETYEIQELHLPVYHTLCLMLEYYFFGPEIHS